MTTELKAKSMLQFHSRTFATNWDANIYRGCGHKCTYCFAQYSHNYMSSNDFFNDIYVKSNAAQILYKEFSKKSWEGHPVNVCGVSDCYQPAEAKSKIMPEVIKTFIDKKNPLVITTKSTMILRDIDLLKELNQVAEVSIIISVSTLDDTKRKLVEPYAPPTLARMKMLRQFSKLGFKTGVLFMPIMPYISDDHTNLDAIFKLTKQYNLGPILTGTLHLRGQTKGVFYDFLEQEFPTLLPKYRLLYKNGSVSRDYRVALNNKVNSLRKKYNLYNRYQLAKPTHKHWTQLKLFVK